MITVGERVKEIRELKGISQIKFAHMCDIPKMTLSDLENEKTKDPGVDIICKICRTLKLTPNDIIPKEMYN